MKHIFLLLFTFCSTLRLFSQSEVHPLFTTMPGFKVDKYSIILKEFERMKFWVPDKKEATGYAVTEKEGQLEEYGFRFDGDRSKAPGNLQILNNFKNATTEKGGQVIYEDKFYQDKVFLKLKKGGDTYWVKIYCDGIGGYTVSSIKEAPMKQDIVATADMIKTALDEEGKMLFYGIYFDTDKAVIKPESDPVIAEIAKFLKANASLKVFVVGHTDNTGNLAANLKLSKERAAAVVTALTTKYGIPASQLSADGVGPLSPVASNATDAGKTKNRRVEIVLQ